jgi:hypothetical protein
VVLHGLTRDPRPGDEFGDAWWHRLSGNADEELGPLFSSYLRNLLNEKARPEATLEQDAQHLPTVGMFFENEKGETQIRGI